MLVIAIYVFTRKEEFEFNQFNYTIFHAMSTCTTTLYSGIMLLGCRTLRSGSSSYGSVFNSQDPTF